MFILKAFLSYIINLIDFIKVNRLYISRVTFIILLLTLVFTYDAIYPNLLKMVTGAFTLIGIIVMKNKHLVEIIKKELKGKFLYTLIILMLIVNSISYFTDFDDDDLSFAGEIIAGTNINSPDNDGDILKDGFEYTNSKKAYFNPLVWDTNGNHISDFCDLIYTHKRRFDTSLQINPSLSSEETTRQICNDVLVQNQNFEYCDNIDSKQKDEDIILDIKCNNIVYSKIPDLKIANFTYYEP